MNSSLLLLVSFFVLLVAYIFYGRWLAKKFDIDKNRLTPAHFKNDGIDYVPSKMPVLLGHHFASIAGAAPIIGPITAAVFGWVPVLLWLIVGGIFIGAVHDYAALCVSIRNEGKSAAEVIKKYIGKNGSILFLIFTWSTTIIVIAAFSIIVASTFVAVPEAGTSSVLFIFLAVLFGIATNKFKLNLTGSTIFGVVILFLMIWLGKIFPLSLSMNTWLYLLLGYIAVASIVPVWVLLQPRDYLNSFLLYALIIGGFVGMLFYNPKIALKPFIAFETSDLGFMFPMLFVTVACGAISGFHSVIASGTTSKQLNCETDAQPIAFGGMLIETFLGVLALITAAILTEDSLALISKSGPIAVFADGIAKGMASIPGIHLENGVLKAFVSLVVSAFALTSLDTVARLGRYTFQELCEFFPQKIKKMACGTTSATILTLIPAAYLMFSGKYKAIWPLFGSANQMLASISLLSVIVWYFKEKQKLPLFIAVPMVLMFAITMSALVSMVYSNFLCADYLLVGLAGLLLVLSLFLAFEALRVLRRKNEGEVV
ncbi:MAG: carbon starvation protein A [Candidatus Riflebacteria bacterium]|nr:carbon starvation protein A [Candidatus Riflebacteria bacterium]